MATQTSVNSVMSFQGLSSGLQTDALVNAILAQESRGLNAFKERQTRNASRTTALGGMRSSLTTLSLSLSTLKDKLNARTVASTDSGNAYVSATALGAASGNYEVSVQTVATKARISSNLDGSGNPLNLAVADTAAQIFSGTSAKFAIRGTDGVIKTVTVATNNLMGLRDAINASGAGVTATVINNGKTGVGATPYQLVLTSKTTGVGSTGGVITLADITNGDGSSVNTLGITGGTVDSESTPTTLTGGLGSDAPGGAVAVDAKFTLNGIQLIRSSNTVSDAVDGVTFTLKQGGQSGITTLTVAQDKTTATTAIQDFITKYNNVVKAYKEASTSTKAEDGSVKTAPLDGEAASRTVMRQLKSLLVENSVGSLSSEYNALGKVGIRTQSDGTLTLDSIAFQTALEKNPTAVQRLFSFAGDSSNGVVSFTSGTSKTATGSYAFSITSYDAQGNFTGTLDGQAISGSAGVFNGTGAMDGLVLKVTGTGSGTLSLGRGAGQRVLDQITDFMGTGGQLGSALQSIKNQNTVLDQQIEQAQSALDRRKKVLQAQFSKMEVMIAQMRSAASGLASV